MITNNLFNKGGRLGNQMFQYAALLGVKYKKGYDIVLESEPFEASMLFGMFDLKECSSTSANNIAFEKTCSENCHCFDPSILEVDDNTNLRGYFQTEKYFKHCEDIVKKEFTYRDYIIEMADKFLEPYRYYNLVSVHVRRTDYLVYTHIHAKCDLLYYTEAMNQFNKSETCFVVTTDDLEWCMENLKADHIIFSSDRYDLDLCIQSRCDHHIISNSTFSWWAAWLGQNPNKKIIAPKNWFTPNFAITTLDYDVVPDHWIKITNL